MESLIHSSSASAASLTSKSSNILYRDRALTKNSILFSNGSSFSRHFPTHSLSFGLSERRLVIKASTEDKKNKKNKKVDKHSFVPKPDESTGFFPESVLLKEKKVEKDGKALPEFADDDEEKLFEFLNLQLESELNVERIRHYEVVYLIHEDRVEEVESVVSKVKDFIEEKKGKIWRLNNWGLRRLAYKIKKATHANYILMNFELEAKWINEFKGMLDKDERIIRHLVMKKDEAETEDAPPPPEFHTLRSNMMDDDDDLNEFDVEEDDGEGWDDDAELEMVDDGDSVDAEDGAVYAKNNHREYNREDDSDAVRKEIRTLKAEKIAR